MRDWKHEISQRLASLKLEPTREAEIVEELAQHLELRYSELVTSGASDKEASRVVLAELSENPRLANELRRVELTVIQEPVVWGSNRGSNMLESLWQDLRYGARVLLKKPGFTLVAVITLALGIGANTAIFSVVNAVLLRPLPYRQPEQLVKVLQAAPSSEKSAAPTLWSYPRFEVLRDQSQSFAAVAACNQASFNLTGTDEPERLPAEMVSASYFTLLGTDPLIGRTFTEDEDRKDAAQPVAILGYALWQRRFGGVEQAIGKTIELDKHGFTIIG